MAEKVAPSLSISADAETDHPLTVGARSGIGPLSERSKEVWHGDSAPCASCAHLNAREAVRCEHCGQDLSQEMLQKMAKHSGDWFVYDNVRPFPGVSLERMFSLIKRGALTPTSIVRGPTTYYQWRFALETPLISKHLGRCWNCQAAVTAEERHCAQCEVRLDGRLKPEREQGPAAGTPARDNGSGTPSEELAELSRAISASGEEREQACLTHPADRPLGKAPLIFLIIAVVVVTLIVALVSTGRQEDSSATSPATPTSGTSRLTDSPSDDSSRA